MTPHGDVADVQPCRDGVIEVIFEDGIAVQYDIHSDTIYVPPSAYEHPRLEASRMEAVLEAVAPLRE
jgi:putative component of toxin-antitoxin plasmid stabilization module